MAFSSWTLSAPSPAAAPGLVVTCIAQGKRGVLSSGQPAWVKLGAGPRDSEGHACSPGWFSRNRSDGRLLRGCGVKRRCGRTCDVISLSSRSGKRSTKGKGSDPSQDVPAGARWDDRTHPCAVAGFSL